MNRNLDKFDPAALPAEFMKSFVPRPEAGSEAKRFLLPGQMFASRQATTVTTILGSCVAICLWSPLKGIGGMNHYLLPEGSATGENRLRYGANANPALLDELKTMGCSNSELQAKVFGGATTMAGLDPAQSLGKRNIEMALEFLKGNRIPVVMKHVSEQRGCRLVFQTNTGITLLKTFEDQQPEEKRS